MTKARRSSPASPRSAPMAIPRATIPVVSSGSSTVYVQADVTHVPFLFARNPGWHAFYDQDPIMAEETRRKVYDMLVAEKMLLQGSTIHSRRSPMLRWIGLPRDPGAVESDDLNAATASPRMLPWLPWLLWRGARVLDERRPGVYSG